MHNDDGMSDHPILEFLKRLNALILILVLLASPFIVFSRMMHGFRALVAARKQSKWERKFWREYCVLYMLSFYVIVSIAYQVFQDFIAAASSIATMERVTLCVNTVLGLPARFWLMFFGDPSQEYTVDEYAIYTLLAVMCVWAILLVRYLLNVNGSENVDGTWIPSAKAKRSTYAQYLREEEPFEKLWAQKVKHREIHPKYQPGWANMKQSDRQRQESRWQYRMDEIEKAIDACPRASYYKR